MKKLLFCIFLCMTSVLTLFASPVPESSISFEVRPILLNFTLDYNMLFCTTSQKSPGMRIKSDSGEYIQDSAADTNSLDTKEVISSETVVDFKKESGFRNFVGFRLGAEIGNVGKKTWNFADIGIIDKMMFNKHSGMMFTVYFKSNLDWFYVNGDIKYIHNFNDNFAMTIGLASPIKYIKIYEGGNADWEDIMYFIIGIYDILTIGINIYI